MNYILKESGACGHAPLRLSKNSFLTADCLAEFLPFGGNKMESVISGGVYLENDTAHAANVKISQEFLRCSCVYTGPSSPQKSGCATFLTL